MLRQLSIRNYTIIDEAELELSQGLTIITGETGAGKSILIGALALILGERAETGILNDPTRKCIVEGTFHIAHYNLEPFFQMHELDYDPVTIIRREINPNGKSRAFVNDTPVKLDILKALGSNLVDLHKQYETLELRDDRFQLQVIDALAGHRELLDKYHRTYQNLLELGNEIRQLEQDNLRAKEEQDYLQFQLNELDSADLNDASELETLEKEVKLLENAGMIRETLKHAMEMLDEDSRSARNILLEVIEKLEHLDSMDDRAKPLAARLDSVRLEIEDIAGELQALNRFMESEPRNIEELQNRLDTLYRLMHKHHQPDLSGLIDLREEYRNRLAHIQGLDEQIEKLKKSYEATSLEVNRLAGELTKGRTRVAGSFAEQVTARLKEVGMPAAVFRVDMQPLDEPGPDGKDNVRFLFSANKGREPREIRKVASGGELSRLMLVIKSFIAASMALPTLIFDEIDSGISGETGLKVGRLLKQLSKAHQVVCITHLPQIAGQADLHLYIYKESTGPKSTARLRPLRKEERIQEIARMLSGEKISAAALENARELINA